MRMCASLPCKNTNLFGTLSFVRCFFLTFVTLNPCLDTELLKTVTHESQTKWPFLSVGSEFSPCLAFLFFLRRRLVGAKPLFYSLHRRGETECRQGADRKCGSWTKKSTVFGENVRQFCLFFPTFERRRAVVVFFYSKCGDCHRYLPVLNEFYESVRAERDGEFADVQFLCISRADDPSRIAQFWTASRLSLPYAPETDRKVFDLFGARRVPTTYVLNAEGVCVAVYGDDNAPDGNELRKALRKAK